MHLLFCSFLHKGFVLKQHAASLCNSYPAFSPGVSVESMWCSHTIVLTQLQFGVIPVLILSVRSDLHIVKSSPCNFGSNAVEFGYK